MKTFIWNREHEVLVVNASTIEEAREKLKPKLDDILDPKLEKEIKDADIYLKTVSPSDVEEGYYRNREWWNNNIEYVKKTIEKEKLILYEEPDVIIEEGEATIFSHTNE